MKTLVTGGAGFIGSHLVERLLQDEHEVVCIDDLSNGRMSNLAQVESNPGLKVHNVDISGPEGLAGYFNGVDWVFHLAGLAEIVPSIEDPLKYHRVNVNGTVAVLEAARHAGAGRFVYAASSSCYGLPDEIPTPETSPVKPMYPYALTKYVGERYVMHWGQVYGMPTVSLRLFNVYGPRTRTTGTYGAVFGVFLAQKLAGKPLTVVGDGNQTRDFTFVSDVVEAFYLATQSEVSGEILNVGSGNTYSINYLTSLLGGDVVHIPKRPGEPDCTFADTQKIRRLLDWEPVTDLATGVGIMLENIQLWSEAPVWDEASIHDATRTWFEYLDRPSADLKSDEMSLAEPGLQDD